MFEKPWLLLAALAALIFAWAAQRWGRRRRGRIAIALGASGTISRLVPAGLERRRGIKAALGLAALLFLVIALAGPQWGVELVPTREGGRVAMLAVDTSLSMLTRDVPPSRLEKAKEEMGVLLDALKGNRVGIIAVAYDAALLCPITSDTNAAASILRGLNTSAVQVPGTRLSEAIRLAAREMAPYPAPKFLILLSDGGDHHSQPIEAAKTVAAEGMRIFTIGIGTKEGGPIPVSNATGALSGYKKDREGHTVMTRLHEGLLKELAKATGGVYFRASPSLSEAQTIAGIILKEGKSGPGHSGRRRYQNQFMIPLFLAFLLFLAEFLMPETPDNRIERWRRRMMGFRKPPRPAATGQGRSAAVPMAALILLLGTGERRALSQDAGLPSQTPASAQPSEQPTAPLEPSKTRWWTGVESLLRRGNSSYAKRHFDEAARDYAAAVLKHPKDPRPLFNTGDALYRLGNFSESAKAFSDVARTQKQSLGRNPLAEKAYYNQGNSDYQQKDYKSAVDDFREALLIAPQDADARHNLAVALMRLQQSPRNQKQNSRNSKGGKQGSSSQSRKGAPNRQRPAEKKDKFSREDAQRIMRAVSEREKTAPPRTGQSQGTKPSGEPEEDW